MCNLYSITTNQEAIIRLFRQVNRYVGNLAPMPGVFPDYPAPVIRNTDEGKGRELIMMRWGMPPPPRTGGPPVTNIRNTSSPHWRMWLKPEHRCLVPFNSFAEYAPEPNPETKKKDVVWFAVNEDRPLLAFADHLQRRSRDEVEADPWPASGLRLLDDRAERGRGTHPPEGDAGDLDHRRAARCLDARALGRGEGAAAAVTG
jgi:putative SOS response-associated peptidase YedK